MVVKIDSIVSFFHLKQSGSKEWYSGTCPYCQAKNKFGIKFDENNFASFNCFSGSCQRKGSIYTLLKDFDKLEFITLKRNVDINKQLEESLEEDILDERKDIFIKEIEKKRVPIGYKRVYSNEYLEKERNWSKEDFYKYEVGVTKLDPKLKKNYVIFPVIMLGEVKGYFSRIMMSKNEAEERGFLRWINSDADFGKLLYGFDEINKITKVIIFVEGLFAKKAVDRIIKKYDLKKVVCLVTFGKKLSEDQIKIIQLKSLLLKRIIFFYDFDAINAIKNILSRVTMSFDEILIATIIQKGKDPDDLTEKEIMTSLINLQDSQDFMINKLQRDQLRV